MFKSIDFGEKPTMINVMAQAVWNGSKGMWDVSIVETKTDTIRLGTNYVLSQSVAEIEVSDCDEFVIADALLHINGICITDLYHHAGENPIKNWKIF